METDPHVAVELKSADIPPMTEGKNCSSYHVLMLLEPTAADS
jgi:hypothetical protein|tara:strand:+ start:5863 stop:5988 length:126 start_codon:yes stop_codon:yes gene_type:complete